MVITHFDDSKFTSPVVFSILLLVPIVSSISTATVKLTSDDGDEFAFVLASECMQNLLFIYFCETANFGSYASAWLIFGIIQAMKCFLLFANIGSKPALRYENLVTGDRRWKSIWECVRSVILIGIVGGVITYSPLICEGEEETYNPQQYTYAHLMTVVFLWSLGEYATRGGSMLTNLRFMGDSFLDHIVLGAATIYPIGYFVFHLQLGVDRFFTPFEEPTACNVAGTLVDLVYIFPFTALISGALALSASFLIFACGCFRDEDDEEDEERSLLESLTPAGIRAYVLIQLVFLSPLCTFLLIKWESINGDLFSEYWCRDTPVLSAGSDWASAVNPLNATALQQALSTTVEDLPRQAFLMPWLAISFTTFIDLPKRAFFVKCYPTPKRWFETASNLFSRTAPTDYAEIQRSYHSQLNGVEEMRHYVDYTCAAPIHETDSNQVSFCGSRCLLGTYLDTWGCKMGKLKSLSCSCCRKDEADDDMQARRSELDDAAEFMCNECCEGGKPREGRLFETLDLDDPIQQPHILDDNWVVDQGLFGEDSDLPLTPKDLWWWLNPFGLWAAYAFMLVLTIPEMSPVANVTSCLIFYFFVSGAFSKEVAFVVQLATTTIADRRGAAFLESFVRGDEVPVPIIPRQGVASLIDRELQA